MDGFIVSPSPHIKSGETTPGIMWLVSLSLLPAAAGGIYFFGWGIAAIILSGIAGAVLSESLVQRLSSRRVTVLDGSALLTGLLLSLNMPQNVPLWLPFLGSVFAVTVAKQCFGGLGCNIFNPAIAGRVFLVLAYPQLMTTGWALPRSGTLSIDAATGATPLTAWSEACRVLSDPSSAETLRRAAAENIEALYARETILSLFTGNTGGCIGETSAVLLFAGAAFLLYKRYISWHIPAAFLGTLGLLAKILYIPGATEPFDGSILFHIFSGGAVLGACFMATDMVTSPITAKGKLIFGAGCGLLTALIRYYGGYPEGVSYAILLMNCLTPMIDRYMKPSVFGKAKNA